MLFYNIDEQELNILHFHGFSRRHYKEFMKRMLANIDLSTSINKEILNNITFVSVWSNDEKCILKTQFDKFDIPLINAVPDEDKEKPWYMPNKIQYYINVLENIKTPICLLTDGYDVIFSSFNGILDKFYNCGYNILFNTSRFNYPNVAVDEIPNRKKLPASRYFNAGICIGYTLDLLKFYKEVQEFINIENPLNSELLIVRHAFAKYSNGINNKFIGIDAYNNIMITMGNTFMFEYPDDKNKFLVV